MTDSNQEKRKADFWKNYEEDYTRLQADPEAWRAYLDELALWDSTSNDGLESEEPYDTDEEPDG